MSEGESGYGVQVVSVEEDGTYRCDEAALRRVAEHAAARGLPVAVVSVAGATRGGKSFLLDFFLRYLRAPEAARAGGAWLGADDAPLTGFSWRGGCDRDTKGILLWSEPIVLELGPEKDNEKVAVVLMDTQGTFDSSSTVRDSSTIFAMSTLLSSVQIYNLSQNIKEDDLHYLQLFTEYGKLARDEDAGSPFQVLQVLVRDWSYAYEHPVGACGGQQLLDKRLEVRSEQAAELREIREHVRSAFEEVRCFLVPHPGLTVATSPRFKGCLSDISPEFKSALLELVPSLLSPENISLKRVNGQTITVADLAEYIRTYTEIFNSDTLPSPTTVMKATSIANLESALNTSRAAYRAHLDSCAWVPRAAVAGEHAAAVGAARAALAARRTLAAPALRAARLDSLMQELESSLASYEAVNEGRILGAVAACRGSYEQAMREEQCLSAAELRALHREAAEAALEALSASRGGPPGCDDSEQRNTLEKELDGLLPLFHGENEARVGRAQAAARAAYEARMRAAASAARCLHPASLRRAHASATRAARGSYRAAWREPANAAEHEGEALDEYFNEQYQEFVRTNDENNHSAIEEAIKYYDTKMSDVFEENPQLCLHPRALEEKHSLAHDEAKAEFLHKRDPDGRSGNADHYMEQLLNSLNRKGFLYQSVNEERNQKAVERAHQHYLNRVAPVRPDLAGVAEVLGALDFGLFNRHEPALHAALQEFASFRREHPYNEDKHLDQLKKKIDKSYSWLVAKFCASIGITTLNIALLPAMMFLGRRL